MRLKELASKNEIDDPTAERMNIDFGQREIKNQTAQGV